MSGHCTMFHFLKFEKCLRLDQYCLLFQINKRCRSKSILTFDRFFSPPLRLTRSSFVKYKYRIHCWRRIFFMGERNSKFRRSNNINQDTPLHLEN